MQHDTLRFEVIGGRLLVLRGEIACLGKILVSVNKVLEILDDEDDPLVQTVRYAYNAHVQGWGNVLRYDNAPHHGHDDYHHRHRYDWTTGQQLEGSPEWIGEDRWPHLSDVLAELERWYWDHVTELPEGAPELGRWESGGFD